MMFPKRCVFLTLFFYFVSVTSSRQDGSCQGTENGLSHSISPQIQYEQLLARYSNCSIVEGNLEITGLANLNLDLSFFQSIEIVTGYVIVALNTVPYISLQNLKVIRGRELYRDRYSLYITGNYDTENNNALVDLRLSSLSEIINGSIYIRRNKLCHLNTINWVDILHRRPNNVLIDIDERSPASCGDCDPVCENRCWGPGPSLCQTLTSDICAKDCGNSRCRGPLKEDCCDVECAAGCTGPTNMDCMVCLHLNDGGRCVDSCPSSTIYDPQTEESIPNPNVKYRFKDTCVEQCPGGLLVEDGNCVKSCRINFRDNGEGKCIPCENGVCDKECYGIGHEDGPMKRDTTVNAMNIHLFEGCNTVKGNIVFQTTAFRGDRYLNILPLNISQLRALENIKVITGHLYISNWHLHLTDFSPMQRLQRIDGTELYRDFFSLVLIGARGDIIPGYLQQIKSLGFRSLTQITHGNVLISNLKNLCYDRKVNWSKIIKHPIILPRLMDGIFLNRNGRQEKCDQVKCDPECTSDGCWGPGSRQCLK